MNRKDIKKLAKKDLKKYLGIMILFTLMIIIPILISGFTIGKDIMPIAIANTIILLSLSSCILSNVSLKIANKEKINLKEVFTIVKNADKILILDFIKYVITSLIILILSIPLGFAMMYIVFVSFDFMMLIVVCVLYVLLIILIYMIISLLMSQKNYIISDIKDIKTFSILGKNFILLKGNFFKYIKFELSFICWFIISILTCGIGFLFLIPYRQICLAYFYKEIKGETLKNYKKSRNNKVIKIILILIVFIFANSIGYKYYSEMSKEVFRDSTDYGYVYIEDKNVKKVEKINLESILEEEMVITANNSQICRIISQLEGNVYFSKLETTWEKEPYKMRIYYSGNEILGLDDYMEFWTEENTKKILLDNATILMSMIDDLSQIEFILDEKEDEIYIFTREDLEKNYGSDIKGFKDDKKVLEEKLNIN